MKKKGKKERRKIKREGKERMKEEKNKKGKGGWPAVTGGGRSWPKVAGDGRKRWPKLQIQTICGGASLVQNERLKFCKKGFGERRVDPLERARRGEEDDVIVGGQDGVYGGGDGGEGGDGNGLFGGKEEEEEGEEDGVVVVVVVGMKEEMEGRMVEELVEEVRGDGGESGRPRREARWFWAAGGRWLLVEKKEERKMKEREGVGVFI